MAAEPGRILQIIPSPGWLGVYLLEEEPWYLTLPLVGFALIESPDEDIGRFVVGLDSGDYIDRCDESSNHWAYIHTSMVDSAQQETWCDAAKRRKERKEARLAKEK